MNTGRIVMILALLLAAGGRAQAEMQRSDSATVSLEFNQADILEVLKFLCQEMDLNVVTSPAVSGRVTVFLKSVDPQEALEIILASNALAYEKRGRILHVMTEAEYNRLHGGPFTDKTILRRVPLQHAQAQAVSRALDQIKSSTGSVVAEDSTNTVILLDTPRVVAQMEEMIAALDRPIESVIFQAANASAQTLLPEVQPLLTPGVGEAFADERNNQLILKDYPGKLAQIMQILQAFDKRSPQVLLEAVMLEVTVRSGAGLGVSLEEILSENVRIKSSFPLGAGGTVRLATTTREEAGDYSVLIDAPGVSIDSRTLSKTILTAFNNQEAKIQLVSKEPYVTTTVSQPGTGSTLTAQQVNFLDVGTAIFVTPTIHADGFVTLKLRSESTSKTGTLTTSQKSEIPILQTSDSQTTVEVEDGGILIVTGLRKDETLKNRSKLPAVSDQPFLGPAFESKTSQETRTELLLFLSPKIVKSENTH